MRLSLLLMLVYRGLMVIARVGMDRLLGGLLIGMSLLYFTCSIMGKRLMIEASIILLFQRFEEDVKVLEMDNALIIY